MFFFVLVSIFIANAKAQSAVAIFDKGVFGRVLVESNNIYIDVNFTNINESLLPVSNCWANGLKFHVHENWNYNDSLSRFGARDCGYNYTGNHFDPWAACSDDSANQYCSNNNGCINSTAYSCNALSYAENIFNCELGDWSGKYGVAMVNDNRTRLNLSSFWEINPSDLVGKSIVFHCNTDDAPRVFCAPFASSGISMNSNNQEVQNTLLDSVIARFDAINSSILMYRNGSFQATINLTETSITCNRYVYRIYDSWTDMSHTSLYGTNCRNVVGNVYDPTRSCFSNYSDSMYCYNGKLCNSTSYNYSCNPNNDLYACSPSDLSGRWNGVISNTNSVYTISGVDSLLMPLDLMIGKSIVIECENNATTIACAEIGTAVGVTKNVKNLFVRLLNDVKGGLMGLNNRISNLENKVSNLENKLANTVKKHFP